MKSILKTLAQQGDISYLSYYFAEFIAEQSNQPLDSLLGFSAALVSEANQKGDVCIMLDRFEDRHLFSSDHLAQVNLPLAPGVTDWCELLLTFDCVGKPGQLAPLILEDRRLYLYRYWFYESQLAKYITTRLIDTDDIDTNRLSNQLHHLYPVVSGLAVNEQKLAVAVALKRRFAVISGGPGTGKTTTVINILAVLLMQQPDMRIRMVAPTGKAAARMMESIRRNIESSNLDDNTLNLVPTQAGTIHRLLGYRQNGFRYSQQHRLPLDCVVVDEASMVDLTLMYRLLDALPDDARVILLGDRDQLASVAAGNVLGDITGQGQTIEYSRQQSDKLSSILGHSMTEPVHNGEPISDSVALLTHSFRFDSESGIGQLAQSINRGDVKAAINLLQTSGTSLSWHTNNGDHPNKSSIDLILASYRRVVESDTVEQAFDAFENCCVLCAVHSGNFGVDSINQQIAQLMREHNWISTDENYRGKPVLITSNDYELELFNGDIGILWHDDRHNLRVYFRDIDHGLRSLAITSLPDHETAWAITVHKSQGSEFESVFLILPGDNHRRALSRELLYTAVTRTRERLLIDASESALHMACESRSQRHSGLAAKLGWP